VFSSILFGHPPLIAVRVENESQGWNHGDKDKEKQASAETARKKTRH